MGPELVDHLLREGERTELGHQYGHREAVDPIVVRHIDGAVGPAAELAETSDAAVEVDVVGLLAFHVEASQVIERPAPGELVVGGADAIGERALEVQGSDAVASFDGVAFAELAGFQIDDAECGGGADDEELVADFLPGGPAAADVIVFAERDGVQRLAGCQFEDGERFAAINRLDQVVSAGVCATLFANPG